MNTMQITPPPLYVQVITRDGQGDLCVLNIVRITGTTDKMILEVEVPPWKPKTT